MSDEPNFSHTIEPDSEKPLDGERLPEQPQSNDSQGVNSVTDEPRDNFSHNRNKPKKSGSLLQRLTGSLRRVTGSIDESALENRSTPNQPASPDRQTVENDLFNDLRGSLPGPEESNPIQPEAEAKAPSAGPSEDLRRMTDELDFTRLVPGFDQNESTSAQDVPVDQQPGIESASAVEIPEFDVDQRMDRLTGGMTSPFRRVTGPLSDTDALKPPTIESGLAPKEIQLSMRDTGEPPSPGGETQRAGDDLSPRENEERTVVEKESPGLIRRITGSLRRVTGSLGTSPLRSAPPKAGASDTSREGESEPLGEKPKRTTGPLGSLLTGILRGAEGEQKDSARRRPPEGPDYLSEIRQDLASDELQQKKKSKPSTNFLQRITGNLRRVTGSLGHTGRISDEPRLRRTKSDRLPEPPPDEPQVEPPQLDSQAEFENILLADRLFDAAPSEPAVWADPEDIVIELGAGEPETTSQSGQPGEPFAWAQPDMQTDGDSDSSGMEPIDLLDRGIVAALGKAEEQNRAEEIEPDWMSEIRHEAAEQEAEKASGEDSEKQKGVSSPLRSFLTGIFRTEEKPPQASEPELTDEVLTDRLGSSLVVVEPQTSDDPFELGGEGIDTSVADQTAYHAPEESDFTFDEEASFLSRLQSGFGQAGSEDAAQDLPPFQPFGEEQQEEELQQFVPFEPLEPPDTREVFTISPEDERLLWGTQPEEQPEAEEGRTLQPSYWDPLQASIQETETETEADDSISIDEAYAATFLTGEDVLSRVGKGKPRPRRVTGRLTRERSQKPFEDIRSALLEDYQAAEHLKTEQPFDAVSQKAEAASADKEAHSPGSLAFEKEYKKPARPGLRAWLATRTVLQKIILVEIILVIVALMVVVPLFFIRFYGIQNRGVSGVSVPSTLPRALPAGMPYPTGIKLPGGWQFPLEKSTFVNNEWTPKQSEWLEGTELRRVVALPWNLQTEAVVQTFQPGDQVDLTLSNGDLIDFKVDRVERISVEDVSIYTDLRPSLAIILFKEDAQERWVVFCAR